VDSVFRSAGSTGPERRAEVGGRPFLIHPGAPRIDPLARQPEAGTGTCRYRGSGTHWIFHIYIRATVLDPSLATDGAGHRTPIEATHETT